MENKEQILANLNLSDWDGYLFRCSELSNITTLGRGTVITDKQKEELDELLTRIKLTEKQAARRDELILKRDAPPVLSEAAKNWLQKKWVEVVTGREKYMETKYTEKGTIMEAEGIKMANRVLSWGYEESYLDGLEFNKTRSSNEYITGEPDLADYRLVDIKCPWDLYTFPFFNASDKLPKEEYYWQMQGYCYLYNFPLASVVYCLVDAPEHLINDEIRRREWKMGYIEMPDADQDRIRMELTYQDIPEHMRVRSWDVCRDPDAIERIKTSVTLARQYLKELTAEMKERLNKSNI